MKRAALAGILLLGALEAAAQEPRIADNSFLIEEAYNQEAGVVQHISNLVLLGPARRDLAYTFTQEWPLGGMTHQLSYTIPVLFPDGENGASLGDIFLNYRYQLKSGEQVAIAPRASLLLPTGSWHKQQGNGAPGLQLNFPVSIRLSRQLVTHLNAGTTLIPAARGPTGERRTLSLSTVGGSVIAPLMSPVQVMVETVALWTQTVDSAGGVVHNNEVVLNPGFRFAIDLGSLQIVPGFSVPIHLSNSGKPDDLFFYLSFEHPFKKVP